MDNEREDVECVWDTRIEMLKEWLEKFEEDEKDVMQEERKKNNMKDALIYYSKSHLKVQLLLLIQTLVEITTILT